MPLLRITKLCGNSLSCPVIACLHPQHFTILQDGETSIGGLSTLFFWPIFSLLSVTSMAKASLPCSALSSHFSSFFFPFLVGAFPGGFVVNLFLGTRCLDLAKGICIAGLFPWFASNRTSSSSSKMLAKSSATWICCALSFASCTPADGPLPAHFSKFLSKKLYFFLLFQHCGHIILCCMNKSHRLGWFEACIPLF